MTELKKLCVDFDLSDQGKKVDLISRLQTVAHKLPMTPRRGRSDPGLVGQEQASGRKSASKLPKVAMRKSGNGLALKEIAA